MADNSVTAANVLKSGNGSQFVGTVAAGVTITAGKYIYRLADGTYGLADSNGTTPANTIAGCALGGASAGQLFVFTDKDPNLTSGATLTSGDVVYLSDTPGGNTSAYADIASGSTVITLGIVNTDGTLNFNPLIGGVK